jgi:hypothetical protein
MEALLVVESANLSFRRRRPLMKAGYGNDGSLLVELRKVKDATQMALRIGRDRKLRATD